MCTFEYKYTGSIGTFYSKSNYTVHSVQFTIFSVSPQILHLKADNQTTRSSSLFDTRHQKCLSMTLYFYTDKNDQIRFTIKLLLLQSCRFGNVTLLPPLLPHYCLIFSTGFYFTFKISSFFLICTSHFAAGCHGWFIFLLLQRLDFDVG